MPFVTLADLKRRQDLNCHPQNAGGGQGQVTHEGSAQTTGPDRSTPWEQTQPPHQARPGSAYNTHVHTGKNTALAVSVWETLLHSHCPARPS